MPTARATSVPKRRKQRPSPPAPPLTRIPRWEGEHGSADVAERDTLDNVCVNEDTDATAHDGASTAARSTSARGCVNEDINAAGCVDAANSAVNTSDEAGAAVARNAAKGCKMWEHPSPMKTYGAEREGLRS